MGAKRRVQFEFTDQAVSEMDRLVEATGAASRAELLRYALRYLDIISEETSRGSAVIVERKGGDRYRLPIVTLRPEAAVTPKDTTTDTAEAVEEPAYAVRNSARRRSKSAAAH